MGTVKEWPYQKNSVADLWETFTFPPFTGFFLEDLGYTYLGPRKDRFEQHDFFSFFPYPSLQQVFIRAMTSTSFINFNQKQVAQFTIQIKGSLNFQKVRKKSLLLLLPHFCLFYNELRNALNPRKKNLKSHSFFLADLTYPTDQPTDQMPKIFLSAWFLNSCVTSTVTPPMDGQLSPNPPPPQNRKKPYSHMQKSCNLNKTIINNTSAQAM